MLLQFCLLFVLQMFRSFALETVAIIEWQRRPWERSNRILWSWSIPFNANNRSLLSSSARADSYDHRSHLVTTIRSQQRNVLQLGNFIDNSHGTYDHKNSLEIMEMLYIYELVRVVYVWPLHFSSATRTCPRFLVRKSEGDDQLSLARTPWGPLISSSPSLNHQNVSSSVQTCCVRLQLQITKSRH